MAKNGKDRISAPATPLSSNRSAQNSPDVDEAAERIEELALDPSKRLFPPTPHVAKKVDSDARPIVAGVINELITEAVAFSENERSIWLYADDSSDEEDVERSTAAYNIDAAWDRYTKEKLKLSSPAHASYMKLPFITHALGVELLYGQREVNARYGVMQRQHLGSSPILNHTERGGKFIDFIRQETETQLVAFLKYYYPAITPEMENGIKEKIGETCTEWNRRLTHLGQSRQWLKQVRHSLPEVTRDAPVPYLQDGIWQPLAAFAEEAFLHAYAYVELQQLQLPPPNQSIIAASPQLVSHITSEGIKVAKANQQHGWVAAGGKSPNKNSLSGDRRHLPSVFEQTLRTELNKGGCGALLENKIGNISHSLVQPYIYDLKQTDQTYAGSPTSPSWQVAKQFPELKAAIGYSRDRLLHDWKPIFLEQIRQHAYGSQPLTRQTLPDTHVFESKDGVDLLVNARLHGASEKRTMHNYADNPTYRKIIQTQNSGSIYLKRSLHQWQFADGNASLAEHGIQSNLGRGDYLPTGGSYPSIYEEIQKKQKQQHFTDAQLATWIRNYLNGNQPPVRHSLAPWIAEITHLIIGEEGMRNPAALVTNHMMLDLIEGNRFSWQQAFQATQMPMAPEGATAEARTLHSDFNDYMPHNYQYRGARANSSAALIQREENVAIQWINMKLHPGQVYTTEAWRTWATNESASTIANHIRQEFPRWFAAKNIAQGQAAIAVQGR